MKAIALVWTTWRKITLSFEGKFATFPVPLRVSLSDLTRLRTRRDRKYATSNDWVIV